jgi:hypothetical protein
MGWIYAISSLRCFQIAFLRILHIIQDYALQPLRNLLVATEFSTLAIIYGLTWWAVFKGEPSARGWGITASLTYILISLWSIIYFSRSVWGAFGAMLASGIAGLLAFLWRDEQHDSSGNSRESADSAPGGPRL